MNLLCKHLFWVHRYTVHNYVKFQFAFSQIEVYIASVNMALLMIYFHTGLGGIIKAEEDCTFPENLQNVPDFWKYQFNADGQGYKVTFEAGIITMVSTVIGAEMPTLTGTCTKSKKDDDDETYYYVEFK